MEARANYVATGAFVLLVLAGIAVAALWLAGGHLNTRYALFETHVSGSVSGLESGAPVRLNGIQIGRVANIQQDPENPAGVILLLQLRQEAVVRTDSTASVEMQGLTGARYVEISGGSPASTRLTTTAGKHYPAIASRPSSLNALLDNAPELMNHLNIIADRLQAVLDDPNRRAISQILANMDDLTTRLDKRSQDLDRLMTDGDVILQNLTQASATLNVLLNHFQGTSADVDRLIASANMTFARATKLAGNFDDIVRAGRPGLRELTTTVPARLDALLMTASRLAASLDRVSGELERNPSILLFGARQEGYRPK
jgi:phospholipid/cholesterol/gamma-HCH transport system substrate-binding protein